MSNVIRSIVSGYVQSKGDLLESIVYDYLETSDDSSEENKICKRIPSILKEEGFSFKGASKNLPHSFIAKYGEGYPSVAFLCEYDGEKKECDMENRFSLAMNLGGALGVKRALEEIKNGSVWIFGCPSQDNLPSKIYMEKWGFFKEIQGVLCAHAYSKTCESGSSLGMKQIHFIFHGNSSSSMKDQVARNALSPCITFFALLEVLKNKYSPVGFINGVILEGGHNPCLIPDECHCSLSVKSSQMEILQKISEEIKHCATFCAQLYNSTVETQSMDPDYMPLKTNPNLSLIFCHNLKECGILDIHGPVNLATGLDVGNISQNIPTIYPYIGVCADKFSCHSVCSKKDAKKTETRDSMIKASCALALTGIDIIEKPEILEKSLHRN